ncbi:mannan endo-1,4-beta-mannosidase-like [Thrips palmi]|uniref:Mannan endo-1,4-beta-mannosidase-like n=1 Tax=Thrips palmi TaxID=161013 RepID=A0A6P8YRD5_THRPL|nr:mannan endo-1,4-beta-mannosidase-like [Thrips palmi]
MLGRTAVFLLIVASASQAVSGANGGLRVSGTQILDGKGYGFVMRGINYAHSWFKDDAEKSIPAIARTGVNVVRIVLSNGDTYYKDDAATVQRLLDLCRQNHLVAMLEVHDATGSDDVSALNRAADYWISLADTLRGLEDRVIINVANEWHGSSGKAEEWASAYRSVLPRLRSAGLKHLIVVDAAGWGQDAAVIAQKGRSVFEADPLRNTIFSIHMYEVAGQDEATVKRHIDNSLAIGVPLIIGEFSDAQTGKPVDYKTIMSYCRQRSVGWIAWSWYGNNADTANMDLATGPAGELTNLGWEIVNGEYGVRSTAWPVSTWA